MESTATEFLRSKWRNAFRVFDINKDGVLNKNDYIIIADTISQKTGATPEQAGNSRREWLKYFELYQPEPSIKVDEARFVQGLEELYNKDAKLYKDFDTRTASDLFDRLDLNGDGFISLEEFGIFYEALGVFQKEVTNKHFQKMDRNGDGLLEREEFVNDVVTYFGDPNEETGVSFFLPKAQDQN